MQTVDTPTKYIEGIFVQELKKCIDLGMEIAAFTCRLIDGIPQIDKRICIKY